MTYSAKQRIHNQGQEDGSRGGIFEDLIVGATGVGPYRKGWRNAEIQRGEKIARSPSAIGGIIESCSLPAMIFSVLGFAGSIWVLGHVATGSFLFYAAARQNT